MKSHTLKGSEFPKEYLRLIKLSGLSIRNLAKYLNMNYRRLSSLIYSNHTAMDKTEYKAITNFCNGIADLEKKGHFT